MPFLRKYGTLLVTGTTSIRIPIIKRAAVDFALGADWTPAAGDVKVFVDGAGVANITNLPTAIASGNGAFWEFILTAAELTCKQLLVVVADAATKAVEDQSFIVETYGNASAMYVTDFSAQLATPTNITAATGIVLSGVTHTGAVIPTVSAVTGLTASNLDATVSSRLATAGYTAPDNTSIGTILADTNDIQTRIPTALVGGRMDSSVGSNLDKTGYALTSADHIVGADTLLDRNMATGTDSGSPTVRTVRQALRFLRNKWSIAAGTLTVTKEDDLTASFTATVTTDAAAVPIVGNDPA